jgi:hypothetical protein
MALLLLVALAAGCEEKKKVKLIGGEVEVGGRLIDHNGDPLPDQTLRWQAEPLDFARTTTMVRTRDEGKFTARCMPGDYRVTLLRPLKGDEGGPQPQYWEVTVPPEGKGKLVLQAVRE